MVCTQMLFKMMSAPFAEASDSLQFAKTTPTPRACLLLHGRVPSQLINVLAQQPHLARVRHPKRHVPEKGQRHLPHDKDLLFLVPRLVPCEAQLLTQTIITK